VQAKTHNGQSLHILTLIDEQIVCARATDQQVDAGARELLTGERLFEVGAPPHHGHAPPIVELNRAQRARIVAGDEELDQASGDATRSYRRVTHDLLQAAGEVDFVRFKARARAFLKKREDYIALSRLRHGRALTSTDLVELEKMLLEAGIGDAGAIERAREASAGFGRFVRSLVGLDRQAVNDAFAEFLESGTASREQVEFVGLVVDHLTAQGVMEPGLLYESPFTDVAPQGPEQVFDDVETNRLFEVIDALNRSAVA
jgi:type I restriction enzyme R subunit